MINRHAGEITTFLCARPSFLEGLARVLDFGNTLKKYNTSSTPEKADERAIRADWQVVANDLYETIEKEHSKRQE